MKHVLEALGAAFTRQQDRLFLWVPVLFGTGIGVYFSLYDEPKQATVLIPWFAAAALALTWRRGLASLIVPGALFWLAAGLAMAKLASDRIAAPVVTTPLHHAVITGWVELVEPRQGRGRRVTVRVHSLEHRQHRGPPPMRIRLRIPGGEPALAPGNGVRITATVLPPGRPALPDAYDFGRSAWFMGLGGVGYTRIPPSKVTFEAPAPLDLQLWAPSERLRPAIGARITQTLPGETGGIAAALITRDRGGISEATTQAYRDAGIVHILSISGLHMTIFAGALYLLIRTILSLSPTLTLRFPIKKWAALGGLAGTTGYLLISGCSPPAVRSALMIAVMFCAILLDRPALALRNIALAALVILIITPQSLIDVGFQMSFAAVAALVAGAEAHAEWQARRGLSGAAPTHGPLSRPLMFAGGIVATTLLATGAVAPLAAYHFHKATQYGVLANMAGIPICNFLVMPAALATLVALPFGLEQWPLWAMGWSIEAMTYVALQVAGLPGASVTLPEISRTAFLMMMAGGIWMVLVNGAIRHLGWAAVAAGLVMAPARSPPDVLVAESGKLVAVRGADGRYAALNRERSDYELARWLEHDGDGRTAGNVGPAKVIVCDALGCVATVKGHVIAVAQHPAALADDCAKAVVLLWLAEGNVECGSNVATITRADLAREGAHAVRLGRDGVEYGGRAGRALRSTARAETKREPLRVTIDTVKAHRGNRPWSAPATGGAKPLQPRQ
ncbi:MAG: ComEC/Rec2 family competence protein [Hyphomicrobiaceae bacterium]